MSLPSLLDSGTKLWLDSIDPDLVASNRALGATGATSNPIIIADLVKSGRFDGALDELIQAGMSDEQIAWRMTDDLVRGARMFSCRFGKRPLEMMAMSALKSIPCWKMSRRIYPTNNVLNAILNWRRNGPQTIKTA